MRVYTRDDVYKFFPNTPHPNNIIFGVGPRCCDNGDIYVFHEEGSLGFIYNFSHEMVHQSYKTDRLVIKPEFLWVEEVIAEKISELIIFWVTNVKMISCPIKYFKEIIENEKDSVEYDPLEMEKLFKRGANNSNCERPKINLRKYKDLIKSNNIDEIMSLKTQKEIISLSETMKKTG